MKRWAVIVAMVALLGWASTCVVFVDQTELAFVTRFGRVVDEGVVDPGLTFKMPWPIDAVRRFDRRLQIYEPPALERVTQDKKSLTIASYVCWKIDDVHRFFRTAGTIGNANRRLQEQISGRLSAAVGARTLGDLVTVEPGKSRIDAMMSDLTNELGQQAGQQFGIDVVDVGLKRFNHPSEVRQAIYERIRSERNRDAVRYRSEGDSEAQKIRSQADLERDTVLAKAQAEATRLRGEADAEKTRILNEAHAKDPGFYDLLRTLDAYKKILDDKTTLVLSTDNPIFRLLTNPDLSGGVEAKTHPTPVTGASRANGDNPPAGDAP